ncbi:MAG: NAD(P)H-hydrate dehydratase [Clostridiales Family XIII bacterium]|jgi:NAD(P)H-hydrate epimerase|nr:NAD(P)H-hydrate dehydratase [Clostridiales Family XIII bacterium]
MEEITQKEIRGLFIRKRRRDAHKGDFGRVLLICGSRGMAGAAILCARGALRAGAGLVALSVPDELLPIVQAGVPEATCVGRGAEALSPQRLAAAGAIAAGPGLGAGPEAREAISRLLENYSGKLVLDADALNVLAGQNRRDIFFGANTVITPHAGEAARLLGISAAEVQAGRAEAAAALAGKYGCIAVLKGAGTLVAAGAAEDTPPQIFINTTGNPGMATGGSGDVLTGVIASFMAQGMDSLTAARAGVYIHGLAGDLMAKELGERGLTAGDLPLGVAKALKQIAE